MIIYHQGSRIYQTIFRVHGSALYKSFLPALLSTGILVAISFSSSDVPPHTQQDDRWFHHPYPIAALISAFTFLLTFKTSFSYNRYWEACTALHLMHSKWMDVGMEIAAWHLQSKRYEDIKPPCFGDHPHLDTIERQRERRDMMTPQRLHSILTKNKDNEDDHEEGDNINPGGSRRFRRRFIEDDEIPEVRVLNRENKWSSMMAFGTSSKQMNTKKKYKKWIGRRSIKRNNDSTSDGKNHDHSVTLSSPPPTHGVRFGPTNSISDDSFRVRTPLNHPRPTMSHITSVADLSGGMERKSPSLFLQEVSHLLSLLSAVAFTTLRNDLTRAPSPLAEYVVGSPWPPLDPDYKEKRSGGTGDSDDDEEVDYYEMSETSKVINYVLGNMRNSQQRTLYNACRPFLVLGGVSDAEIDSLQRARGVLAKTALATLWLQEFISREFAAGALGNTPPPIVSRLFQFISDGMVGYNQARKVAYIPFPFAHTQLTTFFVVVIIYYVPILILTFVNGIVAAAILNFLTVCVFVGLWQVSNELEDPFRNVPNDLPLNYFQAQFNEALVVMFAGFHPESWWNVGNIIEEGRSSTTTIDNMLSEDH